MAETEITFRNGTAADLEPCFALSARSSNATAVGGLLETTGGEVPDSAIAEMWSAQRSLIEFMAAQPGGCFCIAEGPDGMPVAFARTLRFGDMEELTEMVVAREHRDHGIGRELLSRCWPVDPSPSLGRVLVAAGVPSDLSLYTDFGVMPINGHWHMRQDTERYLQRRSLETDAPDGRVHVIEPELAVREWKRLEPGAIGHERPLLHEFFGRDRTCLARFHPDGHVIALCWASSEGEIGPAVGAAPEDLVPIVLAALDRVAKARGPHQLSLFCTTTSWWLLRRLRGLGFHVVWPSWIMSSIPLPGLDRYVPTRPPHLL